MREIERDREEREERVDLYQQERSTDFIGRREKRKKEIVSLTFSLCEWGKTPNFSPTSLSWVIIPVASPLSPLFLSPSLFSERAKDVRQTLSNLVKSNVSG